MTSRPHPLHPNPIAGYEDWPAAVRGAAPFEGPDAAATALGGVLGTVLDVRAPIIIGGVALALSLLLMPRLGRLEQA